MSILHIDTSILGSNSVSRNLSAAIVARLRAAAPSSAVVYRDLATAPIPHLSGAYLAAQAAPAGQDAALQADVALGNAVMAEFQAADTIVIGVPMYNFTVPSQLKTWIDRIVVAGKTFRYTETGNVEGLAGGKRLIIALSRGGIYAAGAPAAPLDFQETYLRGIFGFIGITDVEFIRAEGLALGPEKRQQAVDAAHGQAGQLKAA